MKSCPWYWCIVSGFVPTKLFKMADQMETPIVNEPPATEPIVNEPGRLTFRIDMKYCQFAYNVLLADIPDSLLPEIPA